MSVTVSQTKIIKYRQCPAQYASLYLKKGKSKGVEPPSFASELGKICHEASRILALPRMGLKASPRIRTEEAIEAVRQVLVEEPAKDDRWRGAMQCTPDIIQRAEEIMTACCAGLRFDHTVAVERPFEVSFGTINPPPGIDSAPIDDVRLNGIIDRIDELPDGKILIIDYKSGQSMLSWSDAQVDAQVVTYLLVGRKLFPGRDVQMALHYLARNERLGPIELNPDVADSYERWLKNVIWRMERWGYRPETPGDPHCVSCHRRGECVTLAKFMSSKMSHLKKTPGEIMTEWSKAHLIEKTANDIKEKLRSAANTLCEESKDGRIYGSGMVGRITFNPRTKLQNKRRAVMAITDAMLSEMPELSPAAPPSTGNEAAGMADEVTRLRADNLKLRTALDVMDALSGDVTVKATNALVKSMPKQMRPAVRKAVIAQQSSGGYYSLEIDEAKSLFLPPVPTAEEQAEAEAQVEERILAKTPAKVTPQPAVPTSVTVAATPEPRSGCVACGGSGTSTSGSPCAACARRPGPPPPKSISVSSFEEPADPLSGDDAMEMIKSVSSSRKRSI